MDVRGQAAIVSGGASGLGAATARALAGAGAKVAVLDRDIERAQALAQEIGGAAFACDVTKADAVETAVSAAAARHGAARIAVACAGIAPGARVVGKSGAMALDAFSNVIAVNLIGTFNLIRVAAAAMTELEPLGASGERGVLITTASIAAEDGQIGQAAYAASKGGVAAMTLPIARELARSAIRIVSIAPGLFSTPMMAGLPAEVQEGLAATVPFPSRLGDPSEYAALALHIIANPMLNGSMIRLDGALRMPPK